MIGKARVLITSGAAILLAACSYQTYQSAYGDAGLENRYFHTLFIVFLVVCAVMYALVIAFLIGGLVRSRRRREDADIVETGRHKTSNPAMRTSLLGWTILVSTGLAALAIASFFTDRSMAKAAANERLSINVTGNQWWWDVTYNASEPANMLHTANEIHVPVGVPTRILLSSNDVIHSFWVPSLTGKQDLIPGRENDITIVPTRVGIYRGQCAEFCGAQHAHMAFVVNVDSYPDFLKWWQQQLRPAFAPQTPEQLAGYHYVTQGPCAACHNISGTPASGKIAPDLTHLASRRSIAAGMMPMSKGNLYGWVEDPQSIKPGSRMPTIGLEPQQLHAVVAYLESLK
jgi:cytochrome c oxidase subunit 2